MKKHNYIMLFLFSMWGTLSASPTNTSPYLKIDQFGYLCSAKKVAVIVDPQTGYNAAEAFSPGTGANQYQIRRWTDDVVVFSGTLQAWNGGATHAQSGDRGWWFDFSSVTTAGSYYVYDVANNVGSYRFEIGDNVYQEVLKHSLRVYFYQRIGIAKTTAHSDAKWTDGAWYTGTDQDQAARSRWDKTNPATARDLSGGWFDAGDPNKYTTFAQSVVLELLEAYRMNPAVFADNYNIPESGNGIPDILDEVKWELDFFKKMQDGTGTNGFFLKVGVDNYNTVSPPSLDTRPRYYVPECTSATLSGCAMFALGGVVYRALSDPGMQSFGNNLVARAELAWARAQVTTNNFTTFETSCDDQNITSGDADNSAAVQLQSAVIAAIYLYEATGNATYKNFVESKYTQVEPYSNTWWGPYNAGAQLALLRYASLGGVSSTVASNIRNQKAGQNGVLSINDYNAQTDLYRGYMPDAQYHWGSNQVKATAGNHNLDFVTFNLNTTSHSLYKEVAAEYLHYFHGQNPQGMVYLSNMYAYGAEKSANEIYHMWFDNGTDWDNAQTSPKGPAPGYVTGGANASFGVTTISPPAGQPAQKAYKDWNTGWPENSWEITEPAIYSQAAYVRLLSRVIALNTSCNAVVTIPNAPGNLVASAVSSNQINLSWSDNANDETVYKVERATAATGPWTEIASSLAPNTVSYSATGLSASTTYYFRVRAGNSAGDSGYSNTANATTAAAVDVTTQVYTDALQADWSDWSWSVTNNFSNTSPVKVGTRSLKVTYNAAYSGLSLRKGTAHLSNNLKEIRFWVYATSAMTMSFYTQPTDSGPSSTIVSFTTASKKWKEIVITRAQLGNPTTIQRLNFQIGNTTGIVNYDEIRLINTGTPQFQAGPELASLGSKVSSSKAISNLLVYPNPGLGRFNLAFETKQLPTANALVKVFELSTGKEVLSQVIGLNFGQNSIPLDLQNFAAGAYAVRLSVEGQSYYTKLLLQR